MKRLIPITIIVLLLILIRNISISILESVKEEGVREKLEKQIAEEKKRQTYLKERLYYVETDDFIRDEAKEKLGMLPPGEIFVIAPTKSPEHDLNMEIDTRPNWEKWMDLFFN